MAEPVIFLTGLQVFQWYTTYRMQTALQTENLQTLVFPAAKVQWVEEGREILVEGKMFDIKGFIIKDGFFTAQGIYDDDETSIVAFLSGPVTSKQQTYYLVQLLLLSQCFIAFAGCCFQFYKPAFLKKAYNHFLLNYSSPCCWLDVPPPKMIYFFLYKSFLNII